jgi:hypothetical protein
MVSEIIPESRATSVGISTLHALRDGFMDQGLRWVVDVDISKYLDPVA